MVIDSHTHAWGPPSEDHPWVNGPIIDLVETFDTRTIYPAEDLLADMDAAGIDEAVVVGYPICRWTDNWYTLQCAEEYDRLYGIVMIDQFAANAANVLREHMAVDGVLGFRLGAICPYDRMWETFDSSVSWLRDAIAEESFWEAARETDAVVQILPRVEQLDQVRELVETYPDLTYLIDHYAHANPEVAPEDGPFTAFADLAEYDNVVVKLSEIVHRSNEGHPFSDMHDHVRWYLDTFGRERVLWGSDYPNVSDEASYEESLTWLDAVDGLSSGDKKWLTERTFRRQVV